MKRFVTKLFRSNTIESSHKIKVYVTNITTKILLSSGNDNDYIFPRSAIKIFQAIPFIQSNAKKNYRLSSKTIALACSSHRGEKYHIKELKKWVEKLGINKKKLKCGIHNPLNTKATESMLKNNIVANQLHNNCAGKHLAMITSCLMNNYSKKNYLDFNHPHQIQIRKVFEIFANTKITSANFGIDGCSAPQYSFKINDIGNMLINLIKSYNGNFSYSKEVKILIDAVIHNPNFIGGTDSLDSRIMKISKGKLFCKGGAEGVFLFIHLTKKIAGIIKVVDGNERVMPSVINNLFKKFKIMEINELKILNKFYSKELYNHAKIKIGSIETNL